MSKDVEYQKELDKLREIFAHVDSGKLALVEGLIEEAAYLKASNQSLKAVMVETGMVRIHPQNKTLQKPIETARQYLKNVNSYAVIIKALNSILQKDSQEGEDEFDKWLQEQRGE